jgi:hypothetical protein
VLETLPPPTPISALYERVQGLIEDDLTLSGVEQIRCDRDAASAKRGDRALDLVDDRQLCHGNPISESSRAVNRHCLEWLGAPVHFRIGQTHPVINETPSSANQAVSCNLYRSGHPTIGGEATFAHENTAGIL